MITYALLTVLGFIFYLIGLYTHTMNNSRIPDIFGILGVILFVVFGVMFGVSILPGNLITEKNFNKIETNEIVYTTNYTIVEHDSVIFIYNNIIEADSLLIMNEINMAGEVMKQELVHVSDTTSVINHNNSILSFTVELK